jgi:hypothetical protein
MLEALPLKLERDKDVAIQHGTEDYCHMERQQKATRSIRIGKERKETN